MEKDDDNSKMMIMNVGASPEEVVDKKKEDEDDNAPLATISEVFSFAETFKTKLCLALGLFWAMVTGLTLPASLLILSKVMADVAAVSQEGLGPVLDIVYARVVLGVVCFISETLQSTFLENVL